MTAFALVAAWFGVSAVLIALAGALVAAGDRFEWVHALGDIPALWLAGGLMVAGAVYVLVVALIGWTVRAGMAQSRVVLGVMFGTGLILRVMMLPSVPALEDDFYRYLWDGAVAANGHNPYAIAPSQVRTGDVSEAIRALGADGAMVLERVNHPNLKTIYPPVAQAAFALSYWIEPWSLRAWRAVCLIGECVSLALILVLLAMTGRPAIAAALYWLNPLIVKELMNSAHMEAVVMPFVLGAIVLVAARRPVMAAAAMGLAIGAKLWPAVLLPLVLRPLLAAPARLAAALAILGVMAVLWVAPPIAGGLGANSGFVAYATYWQTNNALFDILQAGLRFGLEGLEAIGILGLSGVPGAPGDAKAVAGALVRLISIGAVVAIALWVAREVACDAGLIVQKALVIVLATFLLSPAQFPWYAAWVLVFAPLVPLWTLVAMTVFMPLYYVSFHLLATDLYATSNAWLVRAEWLPILAALVFDARRQLRQRSDGGRSAIDIPGKRT